MGQVFGEDLAGVHEGDWIVFGRKYHDTEGDSYQSVGWDETLEVGRGYWIKTTEVGQEVTVQGLYSVPVEASLEGDGGGRYNLMGHPFEFDVCWADVEVINPAATPQQCANTPTCTLGEADAAGFISRIAHKWASGNYAAFDGQTPGLKGTLVPWDGFWVEAFAEGIKLKIPANPAGDCEALAETVSQAVAFRKSKNKKETFDGGSLTSDAGWLLFGSLDRQHRLCEGFSSCISESRDQRYIRHDLLKLIRQRVLQIVAGYEDCNDADTLRSDPMLKTVCDQLPESDPDLATQPTFSRLENSVTKKDLMRLSRWLLGRYVRSLKKRRPSKIILDLDSTDDHTHGQQEFSFYHGYYRNHILHPLLIFDAATGDLVCAMLRPGNKGAASHIVPVLKRVVEAIRQGVGTDVEIEIRADSGFATPRLYEFCEGEENKLQYVIGLSRNPRLQRVVEPLLDSTRLRFVELEEKQRQFDEFLYRAHSWDRSRRVIVKVEVDQRGINRRFVVTNRDDLCSQSLYDHYTNRGQTENFIKAFKNHLSMDRLSCHRFLANQFRLLLHALAYQMFVRLRDYLHGTPWHKLEIETLRRRVLKIGARIRQTTRRIWVHLSSAFPEQPLFHLVLSRLNSS